MKLLHYTLNTAHTFDSGGKAFSQKTLKSLQPLATRAILEGSTEGPLPRPFDNYRAKITAIAGAALFDLYSPTAILNANAIAWSAEGEAEVWPLFEQAYLRMSAKFGTISISRPPTVPRRRPWLATLILPSPEAIALPWLADCEQCLAITLILAAQPRHGRPRGFGR